MGQARAQNLTNTEGKTLEKGVPGNAPEVHTDRASRSATPTREKHTVSRRHGEQRRQSPSRRPGRVETQEHFRKYTVPTYWWTTAVLATVSLPVAGIAAQTFPPFYAWIAILFSVGVGLLSKKIAERERREKKSPQWLIVAGWLSIVVPAAGFGFGMGHWATDAALSWAWVVASVVTFNCLCSTMLTGRPVQAVACVLASWGAVTLINGSVAAISAFCLAALLLVLVGRYQIVVNRNRMERDNARERERNRAEDILRDYEETGQGWFWETDRRGLVTYVSASVFKALGRDETDVVGRPFTELFDLGDDNREGERTLTFHLSARSSFQELGVKAATVGEERFWSINGRPAYDGFKNFVGFRGSGTDLTEKRRSEENVARLAQYDSLTGLANRFQMQQSLEKILSARQEQDRECSVFLLDLDRFKHVNDTLGHPAGDALLKQVSQRLGRAVGKEGQVGRLGGDEFEVILPGRVTRAELTELAQQIIHSLSQPYSIEGQRVIIGASIGIAVAPDDGTNSEALIRNSDLALYAAKDGGRGRYHFYSNDLHSAAEERNLLEQDLRDAIAEGALELHYQPVVEANSNEVSGFEALLRWNHPTRGWLSPAKFIPIAEDTGLINTIGEWAIRTACNDLAQWPPHIRCAVNVSTLQFSNPQLPAIITNALARSGIHPPRLELEITESVFLNDDAGTDAMFAALKRVGVRMALDDFGTGYSSLGYLKKAPFDKIKIDQSFVRGATETGSRNGALITSITSLAKSLGMDTTAEGVETLDELELVRSLGCSHVQGYIYSKALDSEAAHELLLSGGKVEPKGPRSARAPRVTMLRKVMLDNDGEYYRGTVRNMSVGGAMIEGLWNVPPGTEFRVALSKTLIVPAVTIWAEDNRMGVQFARQVDLDNLDPPQSGATPRSPKAKSA